MFSFFKRVVRGCAHIGAMNRGRRPMISRAIRPAIEAIEKRCLLSGVPAGPIVLIDGFDGPHYDSQPLVVSWEAIDPIGVSGANVTVQRANEAPFFTSLLASDTTNLGHLTPGNYVIIVNSTNTAGATSSYSRDVNVLDDDTDGPAIHVTGFDGGQSAVGTQEVFWTITDPSGVAGITVLLEQLVGSTWQPIHQYAGSAASGSFNFDTYGPGRYSISVTATDTDNDRTGDAASSSFSQTIDVVGDAVAEGLTIRVTGAEPIQTDDQTQRIAWTATGPAAVQSVVLRVDSVTTPNFVNTPFSGGSGSFNFDHFNPGDYTFFLTATDAAGATTTFVRTIQIIDDDNAPPMISVGGLASPQSSSAVNALTWNITDPSGLSDVRVKIYKGPTTLYSYTGTEGSGSFNLDNSGTGTIGIEIFAFDNDGDRTDDDRGTNIYREVLIEPAPGANIITLGGSSGAQTDGENQHFTWAVTGGTITAVNFLAYTSSVFTLSPLPIAAGSHDFNTLGIGRFYLSVTATDSQGIQTIATREVVVTDDDTTGPQITLDGSIGEEPDSASQLFTWSISDLSGVSSATITIARFHNGASTALLTSSAHSGSYNFDSQGPGVYTLTVKATDDDSDRSTDTASSFAMREVLIVAGNAPPTIVISNVPAVQSDSDDQLITWSMSDANGIASALITLTKYTGGSGNIVATSAFPNGSFDFNAYGAGTFILSVTATDASAAAASITDTRTIVVLDDDTLPPTILITGSAGRENDGQTQAFAWNVSDASGLASVNIAITRNIGAGAQVIHNSSNPVGAFNFDHLGLGAYLITITATDADGDWLSDASSSEMIRSVTVIDDDNSPPQITLSGSTGTESHGLTNQFTWEVTGGSAIVTITKGIEVIHDGTATDGTFNLDSFGLGVFEITITAADDDIDWIGDALPDVTATRQVTVINHAPVFVAAQPVEPAYEGSQTAFTASATDADGETLIYTWDFGDGAVATGASPSHLYANSGSYSVTLTIADAYGSITHSMTVVVANVAPAAGITGLPVISSEGGLISLTATATDVSPADNSAGFTYSWSVTRNAVSYTSGSGAAIAFTPNDNGTYEITVSATDKDGGAGTFSGTIEVVNVAPTANLTGAPNAGEEGSVLEISPIITDPGQADMAAGFIHAWTIAKDGLPYASSTAAILSFTPADNGAYIVNLVVTDKDGGVSVAAAHTILVSNVAPTVTLAESPAELLEGGTIVLDGSATDPSSIDTVTGLTLAWTIAHNGSDVASGTGGQITFVADDNGVYTVILSATDKDDGIGTASRTLTVTNVAPTALTVDAPTTAFEGSAIALNGSAMDPSAADTAAGFTYSWTIQRDGASAASGVSESFSFTPVDDGEYVVNLVVIDKDGGVSQTASHTITVNNVAPTAIIVGAPTTGLEGSTILLNGSATDPSIADTDAGFDYVWIIQRDHAYYAGGEGESFSFTPADNGEYAVSLIVTDKDGGVSLAAEQTILVSNVAPTVTITAPAAGVRYQSLPFSAAFSDPGLVDTHTVTWNFGDGTVLSTRNVSEAGAMSPSHEYAANGQYTVSVTITDKDGGAATASTTLAIQSVLRSDGITYIGGTSSTNIIAITSLGIAMDGVGLGTIGDASRIVVFAGPGHDIVAVSNSVSTPVELYGGPGNDTLKGGSGNDIIVGGDGNDLLSGSYGRDLIIGGDGADILIGNADDDILVAGATSYDADPTALRAIMAEWSSGRNYSTRVANIRGLGSGPRNNGEFFFRTEGELANVFDDGVRDLLMGNAGTDWFIFNKTIGVTDWALDVHSGEFTQDEVMLLSDGTGVIV